ncbi:hypothetical protein D3C81_2294690 [compost metagenome]
MNGASSILNVAGFASGNTAIATYNWPVSTLPMRNCARRPWSIMACINLPVGCSTVDPENSVMSPKVLAPRRSG